MPRIEALTGLRLLAALAVFGSHLLLPAETPNVVATVLHSGYNGVTLFFVLSGFVLTYTYSDQLAAPNRAALRNFAVARLARIAPLYFAALLFVVLLQQWQLPERAWLHLFALQTWSGDVFTAYALNGPAWSIGVETFLYAVCPLLLWVCVPLATRKVLWVLAGAILILVLVTGWAYLADAQTLPWDDPASAHRLLYRTPLTRVPDFVMGIAIALLVQRAQGPSKWAPAVQWLSAASVVALMGTNRLLYSIVSWDLAYAVLFAALIWSLAMAPDALMARMLSTSLLVRGGLISYAFYLFHVPVMGAVGVDASSWQAWATTSSAALGLVLLVAAGAHHAIEVPAQKWLRRRLSARVVTGDADVAPVRASV